MAKTWAFLAYNIIIVGRRVMSTHATSVTKEMSQNSETDGGRLFGSAEVSY